MEPALCNEIHIHIYSSIHIHFSDTLLIDEISTVAELSICRPTPFRTSEPGQIVHEERIFAREKNASRSRKKRWEERICASIAHRKDSSGLARVTNSLRELSYCRKWQNIKLWRLSSPRNSIRSSILRFLHHSLPLPFSFFLSSRAFLTLIRFPLRSLVIVSACNFTWSSIYWGITPISYSFFRFIDSALLSMRLEKIAS